MSEYHLNTILCNIILQSIPWHLTQQHERNRTQTNQSTMSSPATPLELSLLCMSSCTLTDLAHIYPIFFFPYISALGESILLSVKTIRNVRLEMHRNSSPPALRFNNQDPLNNKVSTLPSHLRGSEEIQSGSTLHLASRISKKSLSSVRGWGDVRGVRKVDLETSKRRQDRTALPRGGGEKELEGNKEVREENSSPGSEDLLVAQQTLDRCFDALSLLLAQSEARSFPLVIEGLKKIYESSLGLDDEEHPILSLYLQKYGFEQYIMSDS